MNRWAAGGFALVAGCDVSLDNLVNPQGGIYQRMLTSRTAAMVFIQMDCTARMHPPLDEIIRAAAAEPHYELFAALWNLDKVVPRRSSDSGAMAGLRPHQLPVRRTPCSRATTRWIGSSAMSRTPRASGTSSGRPDGETA
jgi:hypothetical protein